MHATVRGKKGFTLVELLVYSGIFAIIAIVLIYFLTVFFRVNNQQIGSSEVANQANFILQKIQNEIAGASFLTVNDTGDDETDDALNAPHARLVIKDRGETVGPNNDMKSPVSIYQNGPNAVFKRGNQAEIVLNNATVKVTKLTFTKISTPPGKDVVTIDLTLQYNSPNRERQITRQFILGVGKAEAAVFDTPLNPGATHAIDIGTGSLKWKTLFLSGDMNIDGKITWNSADANNSIAFIKQGMISIDPASIASGASAITTASITGIQAGDRVFITPPTALEDGLIFTGATAKSGAIDIRIRNISAGAINGAPQVWQYLILR